MKFGKNEIFAIPDRAESNSEWEEKAKEMFFGSKEEWQRYADRFFTE